MEFHWKEVNKLKCNLVITYFISTSYVIGNVTLGNVVNAIEIIENVDYINLDYFGKETKGLQKIHYKQTLKTNQP